MLASIAEREQFRSLRLQRYAIIFNYRAMMALNLTRGVAARCFYAVFHRRLTFYSTLVTYHHAELYFANKAKGLLIFGG